jgi:hypothetical protein
MNFIINILATTIHMNIFQIIKKKDTVVFLKNLKDPTLIIYIKQICLVIERI